MVRFFCENCGKEVRADARVCTHCGRFFGDVRCPVCDHTDKGPAFLYGCPRCGFQGRFPADHASPTVAPRPKPPRRSAQPRRTAPQRRKPPPEWAYWVIAGGLAAAFTAVALLYLNIR